MARACIPMADGMTPIKCMPVLLAAAGNMPPFAPQIPPIASAMLYISVKRGSLSAILPKKIPTLGAIKSTVPCKPAKPAKLSAIACVLSRTLISSNKSCKAGGKQSDNRCKPDIAFRICPSTFTISLGRTITLCAISISGLLSSGLTIESSAPLLTALRKRCASRGCSLRRFEPISKILSKSSIS